MNSYIVFFKFMIYIQTQYDDITIMFDIITFEVIPNSENIIVLLHLDCFAEKYKDRTS